ncbi:macrophage activating glycoprotein [Pseudohyphozyma bogoriensis]|nr:macrophage activating glycoprotein [Pseudohyphozyma bogoriensis]
MHDRGKFETCAAKDVVLPMGEYKKNGKISTWYQGVKPTPAARVAAPSSKCKTVKTVAGKAYPTKKAKRSLAPRQREQPDEDDDEVPQPEPETAEQPYVGEQWGIVKRAPSGGLEETELCYALDLIMSYQGLHYLWLPPPPLEVPRREITY